MKIMYSGGSIKTYNPVLPFYICISNFYERIPNLRVQKETSFMFTNLSFLEMKKDKCLPFSTISMLFYSI